MDTPIPPQPPFTPTPSTRQLLATASYVLEVQEQPLPEDVEDIAFLVYGAECLLEGRAPQIEVLQAYAKWETRCALLPTDAGEGPPLWHRDHPDHPQTLKPRR